MARNRSEIAYFDDAAQFSCVPPIVPPRPKLPDLTCLRGAAALWVYAYHVNLQLGGGGWGVLRRGYLGVDAFFMLSGLVLAYAHPALAGRGWAPLRFWGRRLARLYPVHLATLALLAAALGAAWAAGVPIRDAGRFGLGELLRSLLLVHGWGLSGRWAWNYPSWSISTEWAGYLAFPWLWLAVRRLSPAATVALTAAAFLVLVLVGAGPVGLNLTYQGALFRFVPEFVAGLALARLAALLAAIAGGGMVLALAAAAWLAAVAALPDAFVVAALWCVLAALTAGALRG
ncbi:acyltransferase family protein, partial [Acidisphaera rubrifaciens]|uniref:acyltransferase family protein n=1 Tax=Acidisphaera rubrifaciens TaxID=50715 RepID=UPI00130E6CDF